eukprot:jgi/Mesvir1/12587/Mv10335-RA.1
MASPSAVLAVIRAARPNFRSRHDKLAFAIHACYSCEGLRLVALGDAGVEEAQRRSETGASLEEVSLEGWNSDDDSYAFLYEPESDYKKKGHILVKCLVMGSQLVAHGLALQKSASSSAQSLPQAVELSVDEFASDEKDLTKGYVNFDKLVQTIKSRLVDPVLGPATGTSQPGKQNEQERARSPPRAAREPAIPLPSREPDAGFLVDRNPMRGVGRDDFLPGGIGPLPGMGLPVPGGFGGTQVGPNHPMFHMRIPGNADMPGYPMRPPNMPPGARFDPYGPPGVPGFEPGRFGGEGRRRGGFHPDLEQPGSDDMFM